MPRQRYLVQVPEPEAKLNLGAPSKNEEIGWAGATVHTPRHVVVNAGEEMVLQAGKSVVAQAKEKWWQYADELVQAANKELHVTSGEKMTVFAGGGQGADNIKEFGEDVPGTSPAKNAFNKVKLMAQVQAMGRRMRQFLGSNGDDHKLTDGFAKRVATLRKSLGHVDELPEGNFNELGEMKPEGPDPTGIDAAAKWVSDKAEAFDEGVGMTHMNDAFTRFNPYSGPTGLVDFTLDWTNKLIDLLSNNALTAAADAVFDVGAKAKEVKENIDATTQSGKDWGQNITDAAKADGAFDAETDDRQARLESKKAPFELPTLPAGTTKYTFVVKIDGGGEITAEATSADFADTNAVTFNEMKAVLAGRIGTTELVEGDDAFTFLSPTTGTNSKIEIRGTLATALGLSASGDEWASNKVEDDQFAGFDTADKRRKAVQDVPKALASSLVEPIERAVKVVSSSVAVGESAVKAVGAIKDLIMGKDATGQPLAILADGGISLGTQDRVYGVASKGFYFVADGESEKQGSDWMTVSKKSGKDAVGGMIGALDAADKFANHASDPETFTPSLGFRVRTDSDIGLEADYYAGLTAAHDLGLVRIESGNAADITAAKAVAIGPRLANGTMEVLGHTIEVGTRAKDLDAITIKDRFFARPLRPPSTTGQTIPVVERVWRKIATATPFFAQKPTENIHVAADAQVHVEAGAYLIEVGANGVRIGSRKETAAAAASAMPDSDSVTHTKGKYKETVTAYKAKLAASTAPAASTRAVIAIDPDKPTIVLEDTKLTLVTKNAKVHLEVTSDGKLKLVGNGDGTIDMGAQDTVLLSADKDQPPSVKISKTAGITIDSGPKNLTLQGANVVKVRGNVLKFN